MDFAHKDVARFLLPGESPAMVEVTVWPVGGQWEAVAQVRRAGHISLPLGRRFRAGTKGEALGEMVRA